MKGDGKKKKNSKNKGEEEEEEEQPQEEEEEEEVKPVKKTSVPASKRRVNKDEAQAALAGSLFFCLIF